MKSSLPNWHRSLDGDKETELVKFCYETEIDDDWSSFEEVQDQVFSKFLAAKMKSNTPVRQREVKVSSRTTKNDQRQAKVSSMERVFKVPHRRLAAECALPHLTFKQPTVFTRNLATGMVLLPHTSHPTKEPTIFTRYFNRIGSGGSTNTHNSLPSLTPSSPIKKISDSPSLKARKWLSNSLTRLFGPLQKKRANQDSVASTERFSTRMISGEDEFCWREAIDHSLSQLRYLAALERLPKDLVDLKFEISPIPVASGRTSNETPASNIRKGVNYTNLIQIVGRPSVDNQPTLAKLVHVQNFAQ